MENNMTYLDSYILQKDMRVRMPKSILLNIGVEKGVTKFDIFFNQENQSIVLKVAKDEEDDTRDR